MQEWSGQVQYAGENSWLIILLAAVSVVVMQERLKTTPELQIKIPDVIVYSITGIGLVYWLPEYALWHHSCKVVSRRRSYCSSD